MGRWIQLRDADMNVGYTGGWCLKYVQDAFGTDHPFPTALSAWNGGQGNHTDIPPMGITVPIYLNLAKEPAGHVAIRLDDGLVASSTQAGYHPKPFFHPNIDNLMQAYAWYNPSYLGWSEYVGSVKVVGWEEYQNQRYSEAIPFESVVEQDPTLPLGQTKPKQNGIPGEHWWVDQLRTVDGVEQSRARVDEGTTAAIPEITLVGTYVEPTPIPEVPVEPPVKPTEPETPKPPVNSENNFFSILWRVIQYIISHWLKKS
jgi:hypothetical protein